MSARLAHHDAVQWLLDRCNVHKQLVMNNGFQLQLKNWVVSQVTSETSILRIKAFVETLFV